MKFDDPELINELDEELYNKLQEDIELLDMAGNNFDLEKVRQGKLLSLIHILYDMNFSKEILWNKYDVDDIYKRYYELVFDLVKSDLFTQLAHPDTIKMFNYYPKYDLTETYHQLAKLLIEHNVIAENNTGCHYRYNHRDIGLSDELLKIFKEHNVKLITASDAHHPEHVGTNIIDIYEKR